ncbi:MAG TPA: branched-chain amino acid ABC transporter substrate-binding protein [Acidimicrobiales bacterium]|nr:branched-chain amino acid ABC transporter substrate-binding protein [Acidimicrobiales bacterium]
MKLRFSKSLMVASAGALLAVGVPLASMSSSGAASKPTFVIGVEGPFSGSDAEFGTYDFGGAELAVNTANASGKDAFTLKLEKFDDQGSPTVAPAEAQKAVATKGLVAIIGPAFSGASEAAYKYYHAAHVAEVSPSATAVALAKTGGSFFRDVADDSVQGKADADYLVNVKGVKNLLVINDESFYGAGLAAVVATDAQALGATVTKESIPATANGGSGTTTEYGPDATQIVSTNPGGIFYGGYDPDFALLLAALANDGYDASAHPIMSGDGSNDTNLITETNPNSAANGVYLSESAAGKVSYFTGALAKAYTKLTKIKASTAIYAAQSYDGINAIIKALQKTNLSGSLTSIRKSVVSELHKVSFVGVTGPIAFQANGNLKDDTGSVQVSEVENGVITLVKTEN